MRPLLSWMFFSFAALLAASGPLHSARAADPSESAAAANDHGITRAAAGDLDGALAAWERAAKLAREAGDADLGARALANTGRALGERGDAPHAAPLLGEALDLALALPATPEAGETLVSIGRSFALLAHSDPSEKSRAAWLASAHRALAAALERAEASGDRRLASLAAGRLAQVYAASGRDDDALALGRRALFAAQEIQALELVALWQRDLARSLVRRGESDAAIDALRQSVRATEAVRPQLTDAAAPLRDELRTATIELMDLLLHKASATSAAAAREALLRETRDVAEAAKTTELRDYFHDDCVDRARARVRSLDDVAIRAAVLYPILLPDRTEILVSFPAADGSAARLERFAVPVGAEELTREVRNFRRLLEKRTTRQYLAPARRLYDLLVRPAEAMLVASGVDTLVFVPDGALRTIPMAALHDGEHNLIERWALATTPGLSLTDPRPVDRAHLRVLLSGVSKPVGGTAPLEQVRAEIGAAHELLGGEVMLDEGFQVERFEGALASEAFNIVHVASHGEFLQDATQSYLLAWDGKVTMDALSRSIAALPFRDVPLELLTLSACETAEGDDRAALGLAGVAVRTGARSAVGTLWQVNDQAAGQLVVEFYRRLRDPSVSRAEALRQAQLALVRDGRHEHPSYWAPFLLIGSWL